MLTERALCRCLGVTREEVVCSIRALNLQTVQEVRDATGAGGGCTCCHQALRKCLEQHAAAMATELACSLEQQGQPCPT
jgi:NifU-like protein